jgi:hypothetical protein
VIVLIYRNFVQAFRSKVAKNAERIIFEVFPLKVGFAAFLPTLH